MGGLVGRNHDDVTACYSSGAVQGAECVGGFVADNHGHVIRCLRDLEAGGILESDGGMARITEDMWNIQIYLDAHWDFVDETDNGTEDLWKMPAETLGYPILSWE